MRLITGLTLLLLCVKLCSAGIFSPNQVIPAQFGISRSGAEAFTPPEDAVAAMHAAGIRWVRSGPMWNWLEYKKSVYDFGGFDPYFTLMDKYNMSSVLILAFSNSLYISSSPIDDYGRSAFLNYTDALLNRYAGKHSIVWELWNEPDGPSFWSPTPNATQYAQLAAAVGNLFKTKYPNEVLVGPSISWIGGWHSGGALDYLDRALNNSLLDNVDAISVHPYRGGLPETVLSGGQPWSTLEQVLLTHTNVLPRILQTEWGYSLTDGIINGSATRQAQFLARTLLLGLVNNVAPIMWYDWMCECTNKSQGICTMGMIDHRANSSMPIAKLPPYTAFQVLSTTLAGYQFAARLNTTNATWDFAIALSNVAQQTAPYALVLWSSSKVLVPDASRTIQADASLILPAGVSLCYSAMNTFGVALSSVCSNATSSAVAITLPGEDVAYLIPVPVATTQQPTSLSPSSSSSASPSSSSYAPVASSSSGSSKTNSPSRHQGLPSVIIVLAVLVAVAGLVVLAVYLYRRQKQQSSAKPPKINTEEMYGGEEHYVRT